MWMMDGTAVEDWGVGKKRDHEVLQLVGTCCGFVADNGA